jgi:prepilin-type N-terminal cleavage/methylation domain-containing protein
MKHQHGFTFVEWMIVVAINVIVASIAIPNFLSRSIAANEAAAIATLKRVWAAQNQCQASVAIDVNHDGRGEYGYFAELAGTVNIRGTTAPMNPPVLSSVFGSVQNSTVTQSGYMFGMYLPTSGGYGNPEDATGGLASPFTVDPTRCQLLWCCYAWPVNYGVSGRRVFFINQAGDVLESKNKRFPPYSGVTFAAPAAGAAFRSGSSGCMDAPLAADTLGTDANFWAVETRSYPVATYSTFGTGCAGSNGVPALHCSLPHIGTGFSIEVSNTPLSGVAFLVFGFSNTHFGTVPLPVSLAPIGAPGCALDVSGDEVFVIRSYGGRSAYFWFDIPNMPGAAFFLQALCLDPTANALGLTVSNAGKGLIGGY